MEEYRTIIIYGIETNYEVSNFGNVRNNKVIMKLIIRNDGYCGIGLKINNIRILFLVHRLVPQLLPETKKLSPNFSHYEILK